MAVKRKIELLVDRELRRVLVRTLEKYHKELVDKRKKESHQLTLVLIEEERQLVRSILNQIDRQWKESLPRVLKPESIIDQESLLAGIRALETNPKEAVYGMTKDGQLIQIIYHPDEGYSLMIEGKEHASAENLTSVFNLFSQLIK